MAESAEARAQRRVHGMLELLGKFDGELNEPLGDACLKYAEFVNSYYGVELFEVYQGPRDSLRFGCQCGWSMGLLVPTPATRSMVAALLVRCLGRMVLHREVHHCGPKSAKTEE
jgi:hypothetical protein